ncbi:Polyketide cyclase OS=Streptomyces microflavus OX=1919 GN=Smic_36740 PE=4 SV=1 [Streptomyces microflavus]
MFHPAAEPGVTFRWMMLTHTQGDQESIWGFDIEPLAEGSRLVHHFRMEGDRRNSPHRLLELNEDARKRFVEEWTAKLERDLDDTLKRIKDVIESA